MEDDRERERGRGKRQLLIESEFEETQKKGEKRKKSAKIGLQIGARGLPTQLNGTIGEGEEGDG